jgi:hypothetical protein
MIIQNVQQLATLVFFISKIMDWRCCTRVVPHIEVAFGVANEQETNENAIFDQKRKIKFQGLACGRRLEAENVHFHEKRHMQLEPPSRST